MEDLEPEITPKQLPAEIGRLRASYAETLPPVEDVFRPRLAGHLLVLQDVIKQLSDLHSAAVEQSDIDLDAETRWVALWMLSGRCLSVSNLLLDELRLGYTAETVGTIRVLDEAYHLLHALTADVEGTTTRRWLRGRTIMPKAASRLIEAEHSAANKALSELGAPVVGDVVDLARGIYRLLSQGAHNAKPGFSESVSHPLRLFNYGPHPDPRQRAVYVDYASELIEGVTICVGKALARFYGGEWYRDTIPPIQQELEAVRVALPIDAEARTEHGF